MNRNLLLGLVLGSLLAPDAASAATQVIDKGTYRVYQRNRPLGTETFSYEGDADSVRVYSHIEQVLPGPDGGELEIDKTVAMTVGAIDYDLKWYQSTLKTRSTADTVWKDLTRALVVNETEFTAYRESREHGGEGDRFERPPGRTYVLDGQVFVLFDVMCRDLGSRTFTSRPIYVILLRDELDQVTQITATQLGADTLRWGGRPVVARKLQFKDSYSTFNAWVGPRGFMVRLEQEGSGLRVERDPSPPLKRAAGTSPR